MDPRRTIEAVWRLESARLIAGLARLVRDVGLAEELAQDALVAALEQWPVKGVPDNPGAWLMTTGKRRAIDHIRRQERYARKLEEVGRDLDTENAGLVPFRQAAWDGSPPPEPDEIEDDLLRLVFTACHPILPTEPRVALALRVLCGLSMPEIARAFLVPETTVAQRVTRAKRTLADAGIPFEVPQGAQLTERLTSVLEVIYLVFNEGYSATAGDDWMRPALVDDALRLGRLCAELLPRQPEVHGLVALLEIQASRTRARTGPNGEPILLLDQDRTQWDRLLIGRGLAALEKAEGLTEAPGPYQLQAAIAACHARAVRPEDTDWAGIAELYAILAVRDPSPVVELNRAVALAMAHGPAAGLAHVDTLLEAPSLRDYHLLPSVRGDLLAKLGRLDEARAEFERAAGMTRNARERALLLERAAGTQRTATTKPT